MQDVGQRGLLVVPCVIGHVSQLFIDAYIMSIWATKEQQRLAALENDVDIEMPNTSTPKSSAASTSSKSGKHEAELGARECLDIDKSHVRRRLPPYLSLVCLHTCITSTHPAPWNDVTASVTPERACMLLCGKGPDPCWHIHLTSMKSSIQNWEPAAAVNHIRCTSYH